MARGRSKRNRAAAEQVVDPINQLTLFNFGALSDEQFEECCCHIFYYETAVKGVDLYNRPRQKQYGVDTIAERRDGDGIEAVSSKRYQELRKGQLTRFVNEFLDHWESHWSKQGVRRFVLCLACDLRSGERRAEILIEKKRFDSLGVEFEVWAQRPLSHRLHEHPEVIRSFFPEYYRTHFPSTVRPTLGDQSSVQASALISSATIAQIASLQTAIERDVVSQLDRFQALLKVGRRSEAKAGLATLRADALRWSSIGASVQARALRMRGLIALQVRDHADCTMLLDEADAISPTEEPRIRALLLLQTEGTHAALAVMIHPTTKEGALLRAGLLIEAGLIPDAKVLLSEWSTLKGIDAEWHRLHSYIACIERHSTDALIEIKEAERLAPDWTAVIETGAIVRYAAALSPAVQFLGGSLPEPVSIAFVKQDDASRLRLSEAFESFDRLARSEPDPYWRQRLDIWRFACLAQTAGVEKEAEAACLSVLKQDPIPPVAMFWALERGYSVDLKASIRLFEGRLRDPQSNIDDLQAAVACAMVNLDPKKATAILRRHQARFSSDPASRLIVESLQTRVVAKRRHGTTAAPAADPHDRLDLLVRAARIDGIWAPVDELLSAATELPEVLWLGCEHLLKNRQWPLLLKHARRLLDFVDTAEAVRLVVIATYNLGRYDDVVQLLQSRLQYFPASKLPLDLQRLKAYAAAKRGDLYTALPVAADLASKSTDLRDKALLVDLLIQAGDVNRAATHLCSLLPMRTWSASELLRWIPSVSNEEPDLARTLLRMATAVDTQHVHGPMILGLNYRLGLDRDANELLGVLQSEPSANSMKQASLEEVVEHLKRRAVTNLEMGRRYRQGSAPIHLLAGPAGVNLAELWDACFRNRNAGLPLFLRSGNRAEDFFSQPVEGTVHLHLDVTAVLTVHHLELLKALERDGLTITLPHTLMSLLQHMEHEARPIQPSRIPILETVINGVANGQLRLRQSNSIQELHSAHIVYELPNVDISNEAPPVAATATLGALADELVRRRIVSAKDIADIRARYANWQSVAATQKLDGVETLIFDGNCIDVVIESGLLNRIQSGFSVWIEPDHHAWCVGHLNHIRNGNEVAEELRGLRHALADGIHAGRYQVLPQLADSALLKEELDEGRERLLPLYELLHLSKTENAWLWVDDRNATSYTASNGNNIVSTYEVLDHLRRVEALTVDQYYVLLGRMRTANVQILPIREAEVLYALQQPNVGIVDGLLVETPSLASLRISFNKLLDLEPDLDLEPLQRPPGKTLAEVSCLLRAFGLARRCLEAIWTDVDFASALRVPASDWLWESFRIGQFVRLPIGVQESRNRAIGRMAALLEISIALSVPWHSSNSEVSLRTQYFGWLQSKLVDLTGRGDTSALRDISSHLAKVLVDLLRPDDQSVTTGISIEDVRTYVGLFINGLPEALRAQIYANPVVERVIKPDLRTVVSLGEVDFEAGTFWSAAASARHGEVQTVASVEGTSYSLRYKASEFELLSGSEKIRFADEELVLLSDDIDERREFLERCRWLGSSDIERFQESQRIASLAHPADRMESLHTLRNERPSARYDAIHRSIEHKSSFSLESLIPGGAEQYVTYLGLTIENETVNWELSAQRLLERCDVFELLDLWSGIPTRLPDVVRHAFSVAPEERRIAYLHRVSERAMAPLRLIRAIELVAATPPAADHGQLIHCALAGWTALTPTFLIVLKWSERTWERAPGWSDLPVAVRLAFVWAHADRILQIFLDAGSKPNLIAERFAEFHASGLRYALPLDLAYDSDAASPSHISSAVLLASSLSASISEDTAAVWNVELSGLIPLLTSPGKEGQVFPVINLFEDRRAAVNSLNSYLGCDLKSWVAEIISRPEVQPLTPEGQEAFVSELLTELEETPHDARAWAMLAAVGIRWLSVESLGRLQGVTMKLTFPDAGADEASRVLWHAISGALPYFDRHLHEYLRHGLREWTRRLSVLHKLPVVSPYGDSPASKDAEIVVDLTFSLSRRKLLKYSLDEFGTGAADLLSGWPALAPYLRDVFSRAFREAPSVDAEGLWRTYVRLRSLP